MKYSDDGTEIRLGDRVRLYGIQDGVVVLSIDTNEYSDEFPEDCWNYYKVGVMVKADNGALVHLDDSLPDPDPNTIVRLSSDSPLIDSEKLEASRH
ncbi:MAG: hypothetical protein LBM17_00315 [Candidatus Accumulibacter sp.]|nr:hypothetical protein [Accumulibacter sp.]